MADHWRLSRRPNLGGNEHSAGAPRAITLRELKVLPPLPSGAIFKPSDLQEPSLDKLTLFERAFFTVCTALAFVSAGFILAFGS